MTTTTTTCTDLSRPKWTASTAGPCKAWQQKHKRGKPAGKRELVDKLCAQEARGCGDGVDEARSRQHRKLAQRVLGRGSSAFRRRHAGDCLPRRQTPGDMIRAEMAEEDGEGEEEEEDC